MTDHTAGEWKVIFLNRNTPKITNDRLMSPATVEELIANYYLMAAAPNMYKVCVYVLEQLSSSGFSAPKCEKMLRAAINKAKPSVQQIENDRNIDSLESNDV